MSPPRTIVPVGLLLASLATPAVAQIITERAPTTSPTIMSDATPPVVSSTGIPAGVLLSWQPVTGAVGYTLCRETPPGSTTCTVLTPSQLPATTVKYYDVFLPPGGSHAYRVSAWRADGHYGTAAPVTGQAGDITTPHDFRVLYDSSSAATPVLVIGWTAPTYYKATGEQVKVATFRLSGTGLSAPQVVNTTSYRVVLGSGDHRWQVTSMIPNPAGGWYESANPVYLPFKALVKYRLVALGFKVLQEATDPPIDPNGVYNEVYASASVTITTKAFASPLNYTVKGATYGELGNNARQFPPGRIRAGTGGRNGGLTAGDVVPPGLNLLGATAAITTSTDPKGGTSTSGVSTTAFPMLLWEGRLNDQGMIVVHPTLWEEDPDHSYHSEWTRMMEFYATRGYPVTGYDPGAITRLRDNAQVGPAVNTRTLFTCQDDLLVPAQGAQCLANGQDRPLGLQGNTAGWAGWFDHVVVLTTASMEAALRGVGTRPGTSPGTIVVPLLDTGKEAKASYELYLRVERLP